MTITNMRAAKTLAKALQEGEMSASAAVLPIKNFHILKHFMFPRRGGWEMCLTSPQEIRHL
jgi:hypothetical protein